jgi:hypothetical protein
LGEALKCNKLRLQHLILWPVKIDTLAEESEVAKSPMDKIHIGLCIGHIAQTSISIVKC